MGYASVWRKALLAASLSGILAYIAQDSIYRGEERLDRQLSHASVSAVAADEAVAAPRCTATETSGAAVLSDP